MMKKEYTEPVMEVISMNSNQQLLAGSITGESVLDEDAGIDVPGLAPFMNPEDMVNPLNKLDMPIF